MSSPSTKGRFIYAKNDPARDFYLLVEGRIGHPEVQASDRDSLAYRADTPGQLFGFAGAVPGQTPLFRRHKTPVTKCNARVAPFGR